MSDLAVIIPAASAGRNMRSLGPKGLIHLPQPDGRHLLRRQVDLVREWHKTCEIVVVVGFEADRVIRALPEHVRVVENEYHAETGPARSVLMGLRATHAKRALVIYGDLVFNRETLANLPRNKSCVVVDSKGRMNTEDVGVTVDGQTAVHFDYGLPTAYRWCQIALLAGGELERFRQIAGNKDNRRLLGWEVLNRIIDRGGMFTAVEPDRMALVEVDCMKDIGRVPAVLK